MNDEQKLKFIKDHAILEMEIGSHLYGTATETSDHDYAGIIIPPKEYYFGLHKMDELDLSITSKLENGKNDSDAIDRKFYNINKFFKLAIEGNPSILSMLFVPEKHIKLITVLGKILLYHNYHFLHTGIKAKYLGYARSQRHQMMIKVENYDALNDAYNWMTDNVCSPDSADANLDWMWMSNQLIAELRNKDIPGVQFHSNSVSIGDLSFNLGDKIGKVKDKLADRLSKATNREELYTKYGYDTKFGMHLIRLLLEVKELLYCGNLEYPLNDRQLLLDIRNGKWKKEAVIEYSELLEEEINTMTSVLPAHPNFKEAEKMLIDMVETHLFGEY